MVRVMKEANIEDLPSSVEDSKLYDTNKVYKKVQLDIKPKKSLKNILNDFFDEIFEYIERL
jgi:hypothetical protein